MDVRYQEKTVAETTTITSRKKGEAQGNLKQGDKKSIAFLSPENLCGGSKLMEAICNRENLRKALKNVIRNKGAAGVDGMTVEELTPYLKANWSRIKEELLEGRLKLQPVKEVEIPKPGSSETRKLGIPIVLDRFISQAILQILQRRFDSTFSEYSYGFRPGKSAHQAISQAQRYVAEGYKIVVDIDLEKFFNKVNHDKLMSELAKSISDKRLLKLLRGFLTIGILVNGLVKASDKGMPQGSPLSPLLSNIMLDLLDKELIKRGHKFCRFADDCNVYVRSQRAGKRVMRSLKNFIGKRLKLKINQNKSKVDGVNRRSFLGFSFTGGKILKRRISEESIRRFKERVRILTLASKGKRMGKVIEKLVKYARGWLAYFSYCQTPSVLTKLLRWMRRKLRCAYWRQWKTMKNRVKQLRKLGVEYDLAKRTAGSNKRQWRVSLSPALNIGLSNYYFEKLGLPKFSCRTC